MFVSTGTGFRITFANGWAISVQYSSTRYCTHAIGPDIKGHPDAEVAVFNPAGEMVNLGDAMESNVLGWQSPDQVATLITFVSGCPAFLEIALQSNLEK